MGAPKGQLAIRKVSISRRTWAATSGSVRGARRRSKEDGCFDAPVPHGAVKRFEDVGAVVEGEASDQDAALGAGKEFADYDGGVAGGAGGHVGAGPHQVDFGVLAPTALGEDGDDRGQGGVSIQPHQPISAITNRQLGQRRSRQRGWREALGEGQG
jgi:hypothetical protein